MPFEHRDHQADVVLVAWGPTLAEAFGSGAQGLLALMVNPPDIEAAIPVEITCEADEVGALFVSFLNEILYEQDCRGMFFREVKVADVAEHTGGVLLRATAWGEPVDFGKHRVRAEVKAATYGQLQYAYEGGIHRLECIVDL